MDQQEAVEVDKENDSSAINISEINEPLIYSKPAEATLSTSGNSVENDGYQNNEIKKNDQRTSDRFLGNERLHFDWLLMILHCTPSTRKKQNVRWRKVEEYKKQKAEHLKILLKNAREAIKAYEEAQKGEPSTPKIPPITGDGEAVVANDGEMDKENTENEKDKEDKTEKKSRIGGAVSS
ncbi:hypothetical protein KQX54_012119 [Cotesia glomerata]|uniref:Uncharacterized protein n=1 Tax=Cotesia glomerata TaxID=32391 RepID=A0AAV7I0J2_COTGL|nr:hypothetical protein KQX54_012119 [Cotesia glomerata]